MGFQRDCVPLAESRGSASGGVWGKLNKPVPFVAARHLPTLWGVTPQIASKRFAKGELKNSPLDCFSRG